MDPSAALKSGQLYPFNAMLYQRDVLARALASAVPKALVARFPGVGGGIFCHRSAAFGDDGLAW
jgi:hypothetical protein